jgi:hypothetical protein
MDVHAAQKMEGRKADTGVEGNAQRTGDGAVVNGLNSGGVVRQHGICSPSIEHGAAQEWAALALALALLCVKYELVCI